MSAPHSIRLRSQWDYAVLNSLVENQHLLTATELRLALVILRRGGVNEPQTVSDAVWEKWTGLDPKMKRNSMKGLEKKGGLRIAEGRGNTARLAFDRDGWNSYVEHAERHRPRTEGRRVDPKTDTAAKIHPDCKNGCALLARDTAALERMMALDPVPGGAQPKELTVLPATPNRKRVSNSGANSHADIWHETLAVLLGCFPLAGVAFLARLVACVRAVFGDVTDSELARAVRFAFESKAGYQTREGLFLTTVPAAVAHFRKLPRPLERAPDQMGPDIWPDQAAAVVSRVADALEARGGPLAALVPQVEALAALVDPAPLDFEEINQALDRAERIEHEIVKAGEKVVTAAELAAVGSCVDARLQTILESKSCRSNDPKQVAELRAQIYRDELLIVLGIPRLRGLGW